MKTSKINIEIPENLIRICLAISILKGDLGSNFYKILELAENIKSIGFVPVFYIDKKYEHIRIDVKDKA